MPEPPCWRQKCPKGGTNMKNHSWHLQSLAALLVLMTAGVAAADAPAPTAAAADPAQADNPADKSPAGESSDPLNDVAEPFVPLHPRSGREQDRVRAGAVCRRTRRRTKTRLSPSSAPLRAGVPRRPPEHRRAAGNRATGFQPRPPGRSRALRADSGRARAERPDAAAATGNLSDRRGKHRARTGPVREGAWRCKPRRKRRPAC